MDEIITNFVKQALSKISKENLAQAEIKPRLERPGPTFRNKSDFEVLEFPKIKFIVEKIDPHAIMIVKEAAEVLGKGFTWKKIVS